MKSAWRFRRGEALEEAFHRVAAAEIEAVRTSLQSSQGECDRVVHEARRSFKKLRALLKLARARGARDFARESRRLRDAGRRLAAARDAAVLAQSFERFVADHGADLDPAGLAALRARLAPGAETRDTARRLEEVAATLDRAANGLARLPWPQDPQDLQRGFRKSRARLTGAFQAARDGGGSKALHEWRKRLKDHSFQLGLFRDLLPEEMSEMRKTGKEIAGLLGEERDLCLLGAKLRDLPVPCEACRTRDALVQRIEKRRRKLRREALRRGAAQ